MKSLIFFFLTIKVIFDRLAGNCCKGFWPYKTKMACTAICTSLLEQTLVALHYLGTENKGADQIVYM